MAEALVDNPEPRPASSAVEADGIEIVGVEVVSGLAGPEEVSGARGPDAGGVVAGGAIAWPTWILIRWW
jgi:hypothetical protein